MELDELHVDEVGARPQGHRVAVAGVLPRVDVIFQALRCRPSPAPPLRLEEHELARVSPVPEGAGHPVAVLEQAFDLALHVDIDALVDAVILERAIISRPVRSPTWASRA